MGFLREMLRILPLLGVRVFEKPAAIAVPRVAATTPPSSADETSVRDTIVVPAKEDGFKEVFLDKNCWHAIRIGGGMLQKIRYIAAYQSSPISAVTHYAPTGERSNPPKRRIIMRMQTAVNTLIGMGLLAAIVAVGAIGLAPATAVQAQTASEQITIEGELIDMTCFIARGARGAEHMGCAKACAGRGQPAAILDKEGTFYTILAQIPRYKEYMAQTVRLTGTVTQQTIAPTKLAVKDGDSWREVPLRGGAPAE